MATRIISTVVVTAIVFATFWLLIVAPFIAEMTHALQGLGK